MIDKQTIGIVATFASITLFFIACMILVAPVAITWAIVPNWVTVMQEVARYTLTGSAIVMTIGVCWGLGE